MSESTKENSAPLSLLRRSGEDGVRIGLYLSLLAVLTGLSSYSLLLGFVVLGLSIYLPFYVCRLSRNTYCDNDYRNRFVDLWASGICTFVFGSLILALVVYVCLKYVAPDFIRTQVGIAIDAYRSVGQPAAEEVATQLERMRDKGLLPTASLVSQQMIVVNIFIGTILSLIGAAYAKLAYSSPVRRQRLSEKRKR